MAFNLSLNLNKTNQIAGLALANVEALAVGESSSSKCTAKATDFEETHQDCDGENKPLTVSFTMYCDGYEPAKDCRVGDYEMTVDCDGHMTSEDDQTSTTKCD